MKNRRYSGVIKHTLAGTLLGFILILIGIILTYDHGFHGPWYLIFNYAPNFVIIALSPFYLGLLFGFIGFRRYQLILYNEDLKERLTHEQGLAIAADTQIRLLGKVVAQVNESIIISDKHHGVQWINDGFTRTSGYTLDEIKGKEVGTLLHGPLTDKNVVNSLFEKLSRGEDVVEELLTYRKDGSTVWLAVSIKPILNASREVEQFIAINKDISNRKEREIAIGALFKEVAHYKFALDQSAIVIIFNIDGKIIHVNRKFCEINELREEELLGHDYRSISISMRDKNIVKPIWDHLLACNTWKGELLNRKKNGRIYWADTTIVPLLDTDGKPYQFLAIQQDITERKELEFQLVANKNKLQMAMQIARLGSWELDSEGTANISTELRLLYQLPAEGHISASEISGKIHAEDHIKIKDAQDLCRTTLQMTTVEYRFSIAGREHYMIAYINPNLNHEGEYAGSFGTVQDITDSKLIALALKKSEEEKGAVLNNTQTIICLHDMNGVLQYINAAAEKISGFTKEEVIGINLKLIVSPEYQKDFDTYIQTIKENTTASGTLQILTKSGAKRVWLYQNTVYANEGNEPYVIASAIDITESVKGQNEIERQQQLIRQIIDNSPGIIFMMNEQRQIMLFNKTFSKYYPNNESETPFAESLSHGKNDIFLGNLDYLFKMEDGEVISFEGSLNNSVTNTISWFSIINKCFKEKSGKKYILSFGMDITSRHLVETELIEANKMVEKSLKVKEQFISNMSHEIRTPLNAVIGFSDLLSDTSLDKEQAEFVDIVKTASANLLALINDILDLSKIESRNLSLENVPISINKIIIDVVKIMEPKAKIKGIQIRAKIDNKIPANVMGDQLRLNQIMFNILGNAIKFTDFGFIDIDCKMVMGPNEQKDYISFTIKDTGIGVPKDKQSEIFERFTQANTDTQRLYGGTGLGLNITKSLVELYGGKLGLESEAGQGTTLFFTLAFKRYVQIQKATEAKSLDGDQVLSINTTNPVHILLAEDNMTNAMLATEVLRRKAFIVVHVANGKLAVEAIQQQHFDLILMDIQMPVMNGINASIAIRQLEGTVSQIPIIAMTAHSLHGEMQNCYDNGMNGYVSKPFKALDLFNTIFETINKQKIFVAEYNERSKLKSI